MMFYKNGKGQFMRKYNRWILVLALLLAVSFVFSASASSGDLEEKVDRAEAQARDLEEAGERLAGYLEELNAQLEELSGDLETLAAQKEELDTQLSVTSGELAEAKETEAEQYDAMKKRIQYMYENRDGGFVSLIFSEDSLSGILNKAEYAMEIASYDRKMLAAYKETKDLVAKKESDLLAEQEALEQVAADTQAKKDEVLAAIAETAQKMEECAGDLEDAQGRLAQYRAELQRQELAAEEKMEELAGGNTQVADNSGNGNTDGESPSDGQDREEPTTAAQGPTEAPPEEPTESEGPEPTEAPTEAPTAAPTEPDEEEFDYSAYSDLELLAAMIYREANMEPWEGKVAVGNVVMNRINSGRYPNTMIGVLSQPYQFSPWGYPKYQKALQNGVPSECTRAAQVAMSGSENYIGDLLHFRTASSGYTGIVIGGHVFY